MKKIFLALSISGLIVSCFAITKADAEKKIVEYFGDNKSYTVNVCEDKKYFIGEVYLKGYEGISAVRKIYLNKETGDIIPEMAQYSDFCYMIK